MGKGIDLNYEFNDPERGLTIEELRKLEGYENYSDDEAEETIRFTDTLCDIGIRYVTEQEQKEAKLQHSELPPKKKRKK